MKYYTLLLGVLITAVGSNLFADDQLTLDGYGFMVKYCYNCHGENTNGNAKLDVKRLDILTEDNGDETYLVPKHPEKSYFWQRVEDGDMPPEDSKNQPTAAEKARFKEWITAGAKFPSGDDRKFISEVEIMTSINTYLDKADSRDRKFLRFFSLTHLYNNANVRNDEFRLYRAALSKAINSLTWAPDIVIPKAIDEQETIYVVDLRDLDWDRKGMWLEILRKYPYGLVYDKGVPDNEKLHEISTEIYEMCCSRVPYLRADWFVATATRPPLYHTLLDLPENVKELERRLKVDVDKDFMSDDLARTAFSKSGVSRQNRLLDRHKAVHGSYWKSYDFLTNKGRGNLSQYPLGPEFEGNPHNAQAFEADGGEMIFNLPNGLQAYYLATGDGKRIDVGPIEVVRDASETSGSPLIVNGLSCMYCHRHGMIREFEDSVRENPAVLGKALLKVRRLYPKPEAMQELMEKDERRFMKSLEEAIGPFLLVGEDKKRPLRDFAEPVGAIARLYVRNLGPEDVASELGYSDPKEMMAAIKFNPKLKQMGLGPLLTNQTIAREHWISGDFTSVYQRTADVLQLGTPHKEF